MNTEDLVKDLAWVVLIVFSLWGAYQGYLNPPTTAFNKFLFYVYRVTGVGAIVGLINQVLRYRGD